MGVKMAKIVYYIFKVRGKGRAPPTTKRSGRAHNPHAIVQRAAWRIVHAESLPSIPSK